MGRVAEGIEEDASPCPEPFGDVLSVGCVRLVTGCNRFLGGGSHVCGRHGVDRTEVRDEIADRPLVDRGEVGVEIGLCGGGEGPTALPIPQPN